MRWTEDPVDRAIRACLPQEATDMQPTAPSLIKAAYAPFRAGFDPPMLQRSISNRACHPSVQPGFWQTLHESGVVERR
jgi:hypothetical protein